jgi:hypothetical protein
VLQIFVCYFSLEKERKKERKKEKEKGARDRDQRSSKYLLGIFQPVSNLALDQSTCSRHFG